MANRSTRGAAAVALVPAVAEPTRAEIVSRLAGCTVEERRTLLMAMPLGEVAAIAGKAIAIGQSAYEVIAYKMTKKHGADWVAINNANAKDLSDEQKETRKAIRADLESIRETVKANGGADRARDVLRRVKEWGEGKRQSKANSTKARQTVDWLLAKDTLPAMYRRLNKAEDVEDAELALMDAIGAYFTAKNINPRSILGE